jgi:gas vesicle protein
MRYEQLSGGKTLTEDISDLNIDASASRKTPTTVDKVKQGWGKRIIKKISMATILGLLGLTTGPVGAALGAAAGMFLAGKRFKNKKVKGVPLEVYMKEKGLDTQIAALHDKYFSNSAMAEFLDNKDEIAMAFAQEKENDSVKYNRIGGDRDRVLQNTRDYALQGVKKHLDLAGRDLADLAVQHNLKPTAVAYLYASMYGDGPLNLFMKKIIGNDGIK